MSDIIPVILCGGSGTRLWPLSQTARPKQFLEIGGMASTFSQALERCRGKGFSDTPIIVTSQKQVGHVADLLGNRGRQAEVIIEPVARDTCAAIVVGVLQAFHRDENAVVLILAADHVIPNAEAFRESVRAAQDAARQGFIVTFGVMPTHPATGYGYIAPSPISPLETIRRVFAFKEKPDRTMAAEFIRNGYLWNSGNFLFRAVDLMSEAQRLVPEVYQAAKNALHRAETTPIGLSLEQAAFSAAPCISFDRAVMEKTERAAVLPVSYAWSDLGSWDSVAVVQETRTNSNSISGKVMLESSHNCMVIANDVPIALVGCEDLVVVATSEGILIARKGMTENLKLLVGRFLD